jgi:hypothetical protein
MADERRRHPAHGEAGPQCFSNRKIELERQKRPGKAGICIPVNPGNKPMRRKHTLVGLAILASACVVFLVTTDALRSTNSSNLEMVPDVRITGGGYDVSNGGNPWFAISNASPFKVLIWGGARILLPVDGGWSILSTNDLSSGWELRPGQEEVFTLTVPIDEGVWRAQFDVSAHGYLDGGRLREFVHRAAQKVELPLMEPALYKVSSDVITNSLSEVRDRYREQQERRNKQQETAKE